MVDGTDFVIESLNQHEEATTLFVSKVLIAARNICEEQGLKEEASIIAIYDRLTEEMKKKAKAEYDRSIEEFGE